LLQRRIPAFFVSDIFPYNFSLKIGQWKYTKSTSYELKTVKNAYVSITRKLKMIFCNGIIFPVTVLLREFLTGQNYSSLNRFKSNLTTHGYSCGILGGSIYPMVAELEN
jgi:hypothetical protein